jgi:hypothetical protein
MNLRALPVVLTLVIAAASMPGAYHKQDASKMSHSSILLAPSEHTEGEIDAAPRSIPAGDLFSSNPIESFLARDGGVDGAEGGEVDKREPLEPTNACRMM